MREQRGHGKGAGRRCALPARHGRPGQGSVLLSTFPQSSEVRWLAWAWALPRTGVMRRYHTQVKDEVQTSPDRKRSLTWLINPAMMKTRPGLPVR